MSTPSEETASSSPTHLFLGHRSKTPTISGLVSGGAVALAWFIGFVIYFYKRHRREKRARALGFRSHREMLDPPKKTEAFIIPPDPAIVETGLHPGERVYNDPKVKSDSLPKHARTVPFSDMEKAQDDMVEEASPRPEMPHSKSGPSYFETHPHVSPGVSPNVLRPLRSPRSVSSEMVIPKHL